MVEIRSQQETHPEETMMMKKTTHKEVVTEQQPHEGAKAPTTPQAKGAVPAEYPEEQIAQTAEATARVAQSWWQRMKIMKMTESQRFTLLALSHLALAIPLVFNSMYTSKVAFGKAAEPPEDQHSHLLQIYASSLVASTSLCFSLSELASTRMLHSFTADILKLGLLGHGLSWMFLFLNYPATLTPTATILEAIAATATAFIPASTMLFTRQDRRDAWDRFKHLPDQFRSFFPATAHGRYPWLATIYSLLSLAMPAAGLVYFIAPRFTLYHTFGYDYGKSAQLIWKAIGAGALMTIIPAMTAALKHKAEIGKMATTPARMLNMGLMGAAIGHLLVLGPIMAQGHGGLMMPGVVGAWAVTLLTSMLGLAAPEVREFVQEVSEEAKRQ